MTATESFHRKKSFVPDVLPWIIAAGALAVFLLTLNHGVGLYGLQLTAQVAGWGWPQNALGPVHFLATYPFRWLAPQWLPFGLNAFMAVCAALTLGQLARAVALLPHDRTQFQREREFSDFSLLTIRTAWLPVVFAATVGGLQLTFWENATAATGEMLNLLLFAFVVRALLEFRLDGRERWLLLAALTFGLAMANQTLMIPLLPFFLMALLWIKGISFFNLRFLLRMTLAGLLGFAVCLIMPWLQSHAADAGADFWHTLRYSLAGQKNLLHAIPLKALWVLGLTSLLPLLMMGIRWAANSGDHSPLGVTLGAFFFHVGHAALLLLCLWVMFDPPFSPRAYPRQFGLNATFLPLYFLSALGVGYFSGYLLLVFGQRRKSHSGGTAATGVNLPILAGVWLLLLAVPAGLIYKNLPQIQAAQKQVLQKFAGLLVENLPKEPAVVLSDDPAFTLLAQAELSRQGNATPHLFLDTGMMIYPQYHRYLKHRFGAQWSDNLGTNQPQNSIAPLALIALLADAAKTRPIYYLHPSFGYYFENFYAVPVGMIFRLQPFPVKTVSPPALTAAQINANTAFWDAADRALLPILDNPADNPRPFQSESRFTQAFNLRREPDLAAGWVAAVCARTRNAWGISLQQAGQLPAAGQCFERASRLCSDNVAAQINLAYNQQLQKPGAAPWKLSAKLEEKMSAFRNWEQFLRANGPLDEPQYCHQQGLTFAQGGLFRQAAAQFLRARQLAPDQLPAYLWLAQIYNNWQLSAEALAVIADARKLPGETLEAPASQIDLAAAEAAAHFNQNHPDRAAAVLQAALARLPDNATLLNIALQLYLTHQRYTESLDIIMQILKQNPDEPNALNNLSFIYLQLQKFDRAIAVLDRLLTTQPDNPVALLNRAIARLQAGQLAEAQADYTRLQTLAPDAFQVYYGLGEIAWRKKDTATAITNYELYLAKAPPQSAEADQIRTRLKELKGK